MALSYLMITGLATEVDTMSFFTEAKTEEFTVKLKNKHVTMRVSIDKSQVSVTVFRRRSPLPPAFRFFGITQSGLTARHADTA